MRRQTTSKYARIALLHVLVLSCLSCIGHTQTARLLLTPGPTTSTVAVGGTTSSGAEPGPSGLRRAAGVSVSGSGDLIIADTANNQVKRLSTGGSVQIIAGTGRQGFAGDGGPALSALLDHPIAAVADKLGNIFIADTRNHRVRRVSPDGTITTIAGNGVPAFSGDGASAFAASLRLPSSLAITDSGTLYIADTGNQRVRYVTPAGVIGTLAGDGTQDHLGDGGPATSAALDSPTGLALDKSGNLLIADRRNNAIRIVDTSGTIRTLPAATAPLAPAAIAVADSGEVYLASARTNQIAEFASGTFLPIAGLGVEGPFATGVDPLSTSLALPASVALESDGNLLVADRGHSQIQRVALPELHFPAIPAGGVSQPQTLSVENGGTADLQLQQISIPSGFSTALHSSCGALPRTLRPGESCSVNLTFTPSAQGPRAEWLTVDATGVAPQKVRLSGLGTAPGSLAPSLTTLTSSGTIAYAGIPVNLVAKVSGSTVAPPVGNVQLLEGTTTVAQTVLDGSSSASFSIGTLGLGPHALHALYLGDAHYSASDSATATLRIAQAPDFTLALSGPISQTITAGASGQIAFLLQPVGGPLGQPVTLSITGVPSGWSSSFSPASPTLASDPVALTLNIATTGATISTSQRLLASRQLLLGTGLLCLCLRRRRSRITLATSSLLLLSGCGSGYLGGAAPANGAKSLSYPLTITARAVGVTGAPLIHSATVTLSTK